MFAGAPYGYRKVAVWDQCALLQTLDLDQSVPEAVSQICDPRPQGAIECEIAEARNISVPKPTAVGSSKVGCLGRILSFEIHCGTGVAAGQVCLIPEVLFGCVTLALQSFPPRSSTWRQRTDTVCRHCPNATQEPKWGPTSN